VVIGGFSKPLFALQDTFKQNECCFYKLILEIKKISRTHVKCIIHVF